MRELEQRAICGHLSAYDLMQCAAQACWRVLRERWPNAQNIHVVCGSGNNGGDGYEVARLARAAGREVELWQVGPTPTQGAAVRAREAWLHCGGNIRTDSLDLSGAHLVVDALLGIGVSRPLQGEARAAVSAINASAAPVLAIDLPSGLDADTGRVHGLAVRADVTVCLVALKLGLFLGQAREYLGECVMESLAVPPSTEVLPLAEVLGMDELERALPPRVQAAHKGTHGHVLVIGGDHGMMGAVLLCARAALRSGAGLVSVATRPAHAAALTAVQPELMCHGIEHARQLLPLLERATVVAIGPGLGQEAWGRELLARVLEPSQASAKPSVIDADALNLLAQDPVHRPHWVLTPHPGEAARLLACSTAQVQVDRVSAVRALHERYGGVAVLKGAGTLVQGETLGVCAAGNPGMAVGGMGDVLTGVTAALLAQGLAPESAARMAVLAHACAGDRAASGGQRGLLPGDVIEQLRAVLNP